MLTSLLAAEDKPAAHTAPASLVEFACRVWPSYQPAPVHRYVASRLDTFLTACEREESPRLLLTLPPRHGKSQLASIFLPAFALGRNADWPIIHSSHTADLSNTFSRQVRNLLSEPAYQECFPGVLPASDSRSVERWSLEGRRGVFLSVGVGGPMTGHGARLLLIDDPVKSAAEADSESVRQAQADWFHSVAYTRLEKGAGILLCMTRWNVADLGGLVAEGREEFDPDVEAWEALNLPAVAEAGDPLGRAPGEALWPEKYDLAALSRIQRRLPPRWWLALYQQSPTAPGGNLLEVEKIGHARPDPATLSITQAWDLAISSKQGADYTVGATIGVGANQDVYLLDITRGHWSFNETLERMARQASLWKPKQIAIETGGYQAAAFQEAARRFMLPFREVKPDRDKQTRAQLLADRISMGKVLADRSSPWWREFESEALALPVGRHDDQVDAVVYALSLAANPPAKFYF
jgi:predicted phage terminase large subunit-like protein